MPYKRGDHHKNGSNDARNDKSLNVLTNLHQGAKLKRKNTLKKDF